jgi:hypothetical protein
VHGGKGPFNSRPGEPGPNHGIGGDVHVVIEGDEAVVLDLDIGSQGRPRQQQADEQAQAGRSAAESGYWANEALHLLFSRVSLSQASSTAQ